MYFDLDSLTTRESVPATIVHALPFLKGKAFVWYYSASSGFKAGVRVICHTAPMTLAQQRFVGEHYDRRLTALISRKKPDRPPTRKPEYIDYSLYSKGHIVYSARPRLLDLKDPRPERVFCVGGDEIADLTLPKTKMIKLSVALGKKPTLGGGWHLKVTATSAPSFSPKISFELPLCKNTG